jgi:hypothetical protein
MPAPVIAVRPLPPLPPTPNTLPPHPSLRRVVSESRPSQRPKRAPAPVLPHVLTSAWANDTEEAMGLPRHKYGLPANPREPPSPKSQYCIAAVASRTERARMLRPTPDSRRVKPRELHSSTVETMQAQLGERGDIHAHALALSGFHGGMDAHYAALEEAFAQREEDEERERMGLLGAHALDLAVSAASHRASFVDLSSRKGSAASTFLLPDFTLVHGEVALSPGQGVPSSPSSSHAPFEWDNTEPFGPSTASGAFNRPASVEERHSTARKHSQPELEIELARKPRPATLQNHAQSDAASVRTAGSVGSRKRMGVILDGKVVLSEMDKRFGAGKV